MEREERERSGDTRAIISDARVGSGLVDEGLVAAAEAGSAPANAAGRLVRELEKPHQAARLGDALPDELGGRRDGLVLVQPGDPRRRRHHRAPAVGQQDDARGLVGEVVAHDELVGVPRGRQSRRRRPVDPVGVVPARVRPGACDVGAGAPARAVHGSPREPDQPSPRDEGERVPSPLAASPLPAPRRPRAAAPEAARAPCTRLRTIAAQRSSRTAEPRRASTA